MVEFFKSRKTYYFSNKNKVEKHYIILAIRPKKAANGQSGPSFVRAYFGLIGVSTAFSSPLYFCTNLEKMKRLTLTYFLSSNSDFF